MHSALLRTARAGPSHAAWPSQYTLATRSCLRRSPLHPTSSRARFQTRHLSLAGARTQSPCRSRSHPHLQPLAAPAVASRRAMSSTVPRRRSTGSMKKPATSAKVRRESSKELAKQEARIASTKDTHVKAKGPHGSPVTEKQYHLFKKLATSRFTAIVSNYGTYANQAAAYKAFGVEHELDFDRECKLFLSALENCCQKAFADGKVSREDNPLYHNLRRAFLEGDIPGLSREMLYSFQNFLMRTRFPKSTIDTHKSIADLRYPHEWYPATRAMQRTVHLHVGPTNSGKTYNALKALENAKSGIYAGPLRLLAHEIYTRFQAKNRPVALITGEEQRVPEGQDNFFRSCTVEMCPLNLPVDVCIIDEIQMIGDEDRGWAWTQAFLGVQAKEVHLCGEERAVDLIKSLCEASGDKCVVHRYQRLNPLETMDEPLGSFKELEKGDAIVTFSRLNIHGIKNAIQNATGKQVATVYGALPPETRAQQAALFNDPNNDVDYLVASDAIGMGLNLEVKRIVFETAHKRDARKYRQLHVSEIKQIGGRAGRYRTAASAITKDSAVGTDDGSPSAKPAEQKGSVGLVTALQKDDLQIIRKAFKKDPEPLKTAGVQPPASVVERFASYFRPNTPFSFILSRLRDIGQISPNYHLATTGEMLKIADLIQPFSLTVYDRCVFLNAPVFLRDESGAKVLQSFAQCVSEMEGGGLLEIDGINLELLEVEADDFPGGRHNYLKELEVLHKAITLYLWLSYRYNGVFNSQKLAFHVKSMVEERIDRLLTRYDISEEKLRSIRKQKQKTIKAEKMKQSRFGMGEATAEDTVTAVQPDEPVLEAEPEPIKAEGTRG